MPNDCLVPVFTRYQTKEFSGKSVLFMLWLGAGAHRKRKFRPCTYVLRSPYLSLVPIVLK